jgi:hypothetical protein
MVAMHRSGESLRRKQVLHQSKPAVRVLTVDHEAVAHPSRVANRQTASRS